MKMNHKKRFVRRIHHITTLHAWQKKRKDVTLHVFTSFLPRGNLYSCPLIIQQLFHVVGKTHIDAGTFLL